MQDLIQRIRSEATYLGNGMLKVDGFINHQVDADLTTRMGTAFARRFTEAGVTGITRVVTAEVSGIAPALATAQALHVPMVFARKHRPITMTEDYYQAETMSHTKGHPVKLMIAREFLDPGDRVLLVDDFLATARTIKALVAIIAQSGATLCGVGCVIEKRFERGREHLAYLEVPIVSLAIIDLKHDALVIS